MKYFSGLIVISSILLLFGCGNNVSQQDYIHIHQNGIQSLTWAKEMDQHFGRSRVDHFISHFNMGGGQLWNSEVYMDGRFVLTLQVPVQINYETQTVSATGKPHFYLNAYSKINQLPDGRMEGRYDGKLQRQFEEQDWNKLVGKQFDLTSLSIPQAEIRPISNFQQMVDAVRKDRMPIP